LPELFKTLNFSIKFPEQFCQYEYLSLRLFNKNAEAFFSSTGSSFRKSFLVLIQLGKVSCICLLFRSDNNVGDKLIVSFVFSEFSFLEDSID